MITKILDEWERLSKIPGGKTVFNWLFSRMVPYTGSIRPEVLELRPGFARIMMRDRRILRNHLQSIHAAALMNLLEATSGLAFVTGVPKNAKAIVTSFKVDYKKKARGDLIAECHCVPPSSNEKLHYEVQASIRNAANDVVAEGTAVWLVSPMEK